METVRDIGEEEKNGWRKWVSYPGYIPPKTAEKLDVLYETLGEDAEQGEDRFVQMTSLLDRARASGLITSVEHSEMRTDIGPEM